jgi:hypothetical protein
MLQSLVFMALKAGLVGHLNALMTPSDVEDPSAEKREALVRALTLASDDGHCAVDRALMDAHPQVLTELSRLCKTWKIVGELAEKILLNRGIACAAENAAAPTMVEAWAQAVLALGVSPAAIARHVAGAGTIVGKSLETESGLLPEQQASRQRAFGLLREATRDHLLGTVPIVLPGGKETLLTIAQSALLPDCPQMILAWAEQVKALNFPTDEIVRHLCVVTRPEGKPMATVEFVIRLANANVLKAFGDAFAALGLPPGWLEAQLRQAPADSEWPLYMHCRRHPDERFAQAWSEFKSRFKLGVD